MIKNITSYIMSNVTNFLLTVLEVVLFMGHPATTNPFIIMMINMTVVFFVLVALGGLIHLIHLIDPTKKSEVHSDEASSEADENAAIIAKIREQQAAPVVETPQVEEGITPEIVAAISAAITAYGFSGQVRAVRIVGRSSSGWRRNALDNGLRKEM